MNNKNITINYEGQDYEVNLPSLNVIGDIQESPYAKKIKALSSQVESAAAETRVRSAKIDIQKEGEKAPEMTVISTEPEVESTIAETHDDFLEMQNNTEKFASELSSIKKEVVEEPVRVAENIQFETQKPVIPAVEAYNNRNFNAPSSTVPMSNISDMATKFRKMLEIADKTTYYGNSLSRGVAELDIYDEKIDTITSKINELTEAIKNLDSVLAIAKNDKQFVQNVLNNTNVPNLNNINSSVSQETMEKTGSVISRFTEDLNLYNDILHEIETKMSLVEVEKDESRKNLDNMKSKLMSVETAKKDFCRKLGEEIKRASEADEADKKAKELETKRENLLAASIFSAEIKPQSVVDILPNDRILKNSSKNQFILEEAMDMLGETDTRQINR